MKNKIPTVLYGKWTITLTNGLWEATHRSAFRERDIYVNFSQTKDKSMANIKRILDSPALRREQDALVINRLLELEDYINSRLVMNPTTGENEAKDGEGINVGKALCEIKDNNLFRITSEPQKYLELDAKIAENEAILLAELRSQSHSEVEAFFNGLSFSQLEDVELNYGIKPADFGVVYNHQPTDATGFGTGKRMVILQERRGSKHSKN